MNKACVTQDIFSFDSGWAPLQHGHNFHLPLTLAAHPLPPLRAPWLATMLTLKLPPMPSVTEGGWKRASGPSNLFSYAEPIIIINKGQGVPLWGPSSMEQDYLIFPILANTMFSRNLSFTYSLTAQSFLFVI